MYFIIVNLQRFAFYVQFWFLLHNKSYMPYDKIKEFFGNKVITVKRVNFTKK